MYAQPLYTRALPSQLAASKRAGLTVLIFLLIATVLGYMAYQNVWAQAKRKVAPKGVLDPANKARAKHATAAAADPAMAPKKPVTKPRPKKG